MIKNKEETKTSPSQISTNSSELIFFFAEWCPHCKTAKPIWEKVSADYNGRL
jgi:thiol-disulfide isomerase/thioredoxin